MFSRLRLGWDQATKKVTYKLDDKTIELWIGKNTATVNGQSVPTFKPTDNFAQLNLRSQSDLFHPSLEQRLTGIAVTKTATITYPAP